MFIFIFSVPLARSCYVLGLSIIHTLLRLFTIFLIKFVHSPFFFLFVLITSFSLFIYFNFFKSPLPFSFCLFCCLWLGSGQKCASPFWLSGFEF
ncbi:hypothetical protein I7I48_08008 [Histoplasma ohiense]|nr:hypothetical protein I7I48_08008 [Histoplasma ohiense (nom. inval.)]